MEVTDYARGAPCIWCHALPVVLCRGSPHLGVAVDEQHEQRLQRLRAHRAPRPPLRAGAGSGADRTQPRQMAEHPHHGQQLGDVAAPPRLLLHHLQHLLR
eukprot:1624229-Pyramimonas_sp.AAC.1